MISTFNPRYDLPTRSYFSQIAIPALYHEVRKDSIAVEIDVEHFSGTTDLWSSPAMEPYLSYTIHYITTSWELKTSCLQAHYMPEDHGTNLSEALSQTQSNWELDATLLLFQLYENEETICLHTCNTRSTLRSERPFWIARSRL